MKLCFRKSVSLLTAILILFAGSAFRVAADNSLNTEELVILPISDIPEVISYEDAIERGHVERLKSEETDMHSVIFRNSDGTKSLYMFASPVKYTASNGSVKDKSTDISITANGFAVTDNDVKLTFGNTSANATTVVNNGNTVTITPNGLNNADGILQNNTMVYNGVFGSNTMLVYTPLLSGLKAGIILKTQGEVTDFSFGLEAIGLTPAASTDGVINLNNTDSETVFEIGSYLVTDANGKYTEGEMILSGNAADGYTVTANVNEAFLNAADTAYPVIVEPSITLNTSSTIDDAIIYSEKPNKAYGAYKYNNIGYLDSYGIGRLLVKFPGLASNTTFQNLAVAQIRSAEYCMYTASASNIAPGQMPYNATITAFMQHSNTWNESDVSWNSFYGSASNTNPGSMFLSIASTQVSNNAAQNTAISVTNYIKQCLYDTTLLNRGMLITNNSESTTSTYCRDFCSTEYADLNNGNLMPYLNISYGTEQYANVKINVSVDQAFVARATIIHPEAQSTFLAAAFRVRDLTLKTIDIYKERFGISITFTIALNGTSSINDCTTARNNYDAICSCYDECFEYVDGEKTFLHHTNRDVVVRSIDNGVFDTHIHAFFTGHIVCAEYNNGTCREIIGGGARYTDYKFAIFSGATNDTYDDAQAQMHVSHEFGHMFSTPDHYQPHPDPVGSSNACIYGDYSPYNQNNEIYNNHTTCLYCTYTIMNNFNRYDHS